MAAGHMDENLPGIDSTMGWLSLLRFSLARLLQLCVFRFCSDENGDVWVGVFPQPQKILICCARLGGVALERVCAAKLEIGLPACVDRIQKPESAQFIGAHDSQQVDRFIRVMKVQRNVGTDHREPVFLYASVKRKLPVQFVGQLLCSRDITCQREGLRRPHWDSTIRGQPQCLPCIRPGLPRVAEVSFVHGRGYPSGGTLLPSTISFGSFSFLPRKSTRLAPPSSVLGMPQRRPRRTTERIPHRVCPRHSQPAGPSHARRPLGRPTGSGSQATPRFPACALLPA